MLIFVEKGKSFLGINFKTFRLLTKEEFGFRTSLKMCKYPATEVIN